jgi:hypothetical protein
VRGEVDGTDYWVEILQQEKKLGAGFAVTRHYVLTALHCLSGLDPHDEQLELSFASGEVVPGRIYESAPEADLALIDILKPRDRKFGLPETDRARQGDRWFAPYRPRSDEPHLDGDVVNGAAAYRCETGHEIEAIQLSCAQGIGNYSGYSGGPVERYRENRNRSLIGLLLEQYPDRRADRASGVLFAATVAEAGRRFHNFGVGHLMGILTAEDGLQPKQSSNQESGKGGKEASARTPYAHASRPSLEPRIARANSLLNALDEWGGSNTLNPMDVSTLKLRVIQRLVEGDWPDGE